jgi:hypothetical protein
MPAHYYRSASRRQNEERSEEDQRLFLLARHSRLDVIRSTARGFGNYVAWQSGQYYDPYRNSHCRVFTKVWASVRDVGALSTRLAPGFVVDTRLEGDVRTVTFANGAVVRERIVIAIFPWLPASPWYLLRSSKWAAVSMLN